MRNLYAIATISAVLVLAGAREAALAGPQAGEVLALFGQCSGESGGGRILLKLGDAVYVGETLEAAAGAKLKLRMNDGSILALAPEGRLTITDYRVGDHGESRDATLSLGAGLLRAGFEGSAVPLRWLQRAKSADPSTALRRFASPLRSG